MNRETEIVLTFVAILGLVLFAVAIPVYGQAYEFLKVSLVFVAIGMGFMLIEGR